MTDAFASPHGRLDQAPDHYGWPLRRLLIPFLLASIIFLEVLTTSRPVHAQTASSTAALISLIQDVQGATAYKYGVHDLDGRTMDTVKIIPNPAGGYLAVYHYLSVGDNSFHVRVATSSDLLKWRASPNELGAHESQPTIAYLSDGGFLVAVEADTNGSPTPRVWVRFKHYASLDALLAGSADRTFDAPHTLVPRDSGAEGTPNIYSVSLAPDLANSTVDVGFHYYMNADVDRQARGTLTNLGSASPGWTTRVESKLNRDLLASGDVHGNVGDRDHMMWFGRSYNLHEVQLTKHDFGSWRVNLYDWSSGTATRLAVKTRLRSTSFANPTFTNLRSPRPGGRNAVVVTLFLPSEGAKSGEGGELIYYKEY
jgi:hypothetical protein